MASNRKYTGRQPLSASVRVAVLLLIALAGSIVYGQKGTQRQAPADPRPKSYTRPKPTQPIKPTLPEMSRDNPNKFFLERADELTSDEAVDSGRQVVKGNVMFRKQGVVLYCDSAYYFPNSVSLDAFGHVRMLQGDTIVVTADVINYDGMTQFARLRRSPGGSEVMLEHTSRADKAKKFLYTDSLDYSLRDQLAYYNCGGRMYNQSLVTGERDTLTSRLGQYNARTKEAEVSDDVFLRNATSRLRTRRLVYHTDTRTVDIVEPTAIRSGQDSIQTSSGFYNTVTGNAQLHSRSLIVHRDSTGAATTLEGDSIVYDAEMRRSEAFMFSAQERHPRPMVITDTARHATLIGGYGYYSDSTRTAYAERYPLLKEYSRPDTIFLRSDRIYLETLTDSTRLNEQGEPREYNIAKAYNRARFFRSDIQGVADSITFCSLDSMLYLDRKPIVWSGPRLVAGSRIIIHMNDSAPDRAILPNPGVIAEEVGEGFYDQLRANHLTAFFDESGELRHVDADTNVQAIMLPMENDSTYNKLIQANGDTLHMDMAERDMQHLALIAREGSSVTGQVIPLMILTKAQYYLPDFISLTGAKKFSEMESALKVLEGVRPKYSWYGGGWEDSLGELSFDLEEYFTNPDMGIPDPDPVIAPEIPDLE